MTDRHIGHFVPEHEPSAVEDCHAETWQLAVVAALDCSDAVRFLASHDSYSVRRQACVVDLAAANAA
jgi:hypothetical protein